MVVVTNGKDSQEGKSSSKSCRGEEVAEAIDSLDCELFMKYFLLTDH